MKVKIIRIIKEQDNSAQVTFWTASGSAQAEWVGTRPEVGGMYDAEVEVPESLVWGDGIRQVAAMEPGIATTDGTTIITGMLDSLEDDGVATVRLGDSLLLVETEGLPGRVGSSVQLATRQLRLFDANL
jgi:hypothetical protein